MQLGIWMVMGCFCSLDSCSVFFFLNKKKNPDDGVSVLYRGSMIVIVEKRWRLLFGCLICKMEGKKKKICWVCIMVVVLFCG